MDSINKIAKASLLSTIIMSSALLYATKPITNVNATPKQNQTEVVSKSGAEALRAVSLQGVTQASVPTVHNQRIDNTFMKFPTTEAEKIEYKSVLDAMYTNLGTFLASAQIQHELDRQQLFLLLEEKGDLLVKNNLNPELGNRIKEYGSDFYKSVRPSAKIIDKWLDNDYTPKILGLLYFDHKPSAKEVLDRLDDIAKNKVNFSSDDMFKYSLACDGFTGANKINSKSNNFLLSELIAFKIFTIDSIIFKKTLKNSNVFGENSKYTRAVGLSSFYDRWINTVKPQAK